MSMPPISCFESRTVRFGGSALSLGNPACRKCGARFYPQETTFGPHRVLCPPCQRALVVALTVKPQAEESQPEAVSV